MTLFFYFALNIIAVLFLIKRKRKLHILEVMVYWMVASYAYQNFSALCYMNFKTLFIPENFMDEYTHFLNRIVLFPVLMVTFLEFFLVLSSSWKKLYLLISFVFLFSGIEWICNLLGVLIHVNWRIWWSFAFWFSSLLFLIGFMKFFRKLLYKGASIV